MMRRTRELTGETLEFNFWPSFTDLMLSVVLIMIVIMFLYVSYLSVDNVSLNIVKQNQSEILNNISKAYNILPNKIKSRVNIEKYTIGNDIIVQNEPALQKISFQEKVLFATGDSELQDSGKTILSVVGKILKERISNIKEIQIQGHADTTGTPSGNLQLGSERSMNVYKYLLDKVGIDPARHLISATTFGQYKPSNRDAEDLTYNNEKLIRDNSDKLKKNGNRRIELLIFYAVAQ